MCIILLINDLFLCELKKLCLSPLNWVFTILSRTKMLGPVLKVVLALLLPVAFVLLLVFGISGSVLVSLGYGFFTPLVATFEAVREGRENKFHHCFTVYI